MEDEDECDAKKNPVLEEEISIPSRAEIRKKSRIAECSDGGYVLCSQQTLSVKENLIALAQSLYDEMRRKDKNHTKLEKYRGLLEVLKMIVAVGGPVSFDEVIDLFEGYQSFTRFPTLSRRVDFKDLLLHPVNGLRIYIFYKPATKEHFVMLNPDSPANIEPLLLAMFNKELCSTESNDSGRKIELNASITADILNVMDSDWDRKCAKFLLASNRSNNEIESLGIDAHRVNNSLISVQMALEEINNTKSAATDILNIRLTQKCSRIREKISASENIFHEKEGKWSQNRLAEIKNSVEVNKKKLAECEDLVKGDTPQKRQRLQQMRKRISDQLLESNRIKRRCLGAGAQCKIDDECEQFIAKAIENKATYHGRRHNTVMYTNRRVKRADLVNIANFNLQQRGKALIRSADTAWTRSRPRNKRSRQSARHKGNFLFCTKKPPKTESLDNENTHYQRAHVHGVKLQLFGSECDNNQAWQTKASFTFMRSIDDKAYLRPGTSEGFGKTRNTRILTPSAEEKARKLPKYDWPESQVYNTPSTHRVFGLKPVVINGGEDKLLHTDERHFVFIRPKAYVDSSGTTWANETEKLRLLYPFDFEVKDIQGTSGSFTPYSTHFRAFCAAVHDDTYLFQDMSEKDDVIKVSAESNCRYREYERRRIHHLVNRLHLAQSQWNVYMNTCCTGEIEKSVEIMEYIKKLELELQELVTTEVLSYNLWQRYPPVINICNDILALIKSYKVPSVRPRWVDLADAGPGVGVSNNEVKFRDAEFARIHSSDYRIRIHRSRGDSGQNEAERTNSAIGDNVVDGGTVNWEFYKKFDDLTDETIETMSREEFDQYEDKRMEDNAWHVADIIRTRIDDAPVLNDFIISILAERNNDNNFFFNKPNLKEYYSATTSSTKEEVPGFAYICKINRFIDEHYRIGELFMEFIYNGCNQSIKQQCDYCKSRDWTGASMERIPQPIPDPNREMHYLKVHDTPLTNETGSERQVDDWQPRANIKTQFERRGLTTKEEIDVFGKKFGVDPQFVSEYVRHLSNLCTSAQIRKRDRKLKKKLAHEKRIAEYDWVNLVKSGDLKKLYVKELNKYLLHHNLKLDGSKALKINRVSAHVLSSQEEATKDNVNDQLEFEFDSEGSPASESSAEEESSDSEDDIVLAAFINDKRGVQTENSHTETSDEEFYQVLFGEDDIEEFYGF